jgi:hypothetical protein
MMTSLTTKVAALGVWKLFAGVTAAVGVIAAIVYRKRADPRWFENRIASRLSPVSTEWLVVQSQNEGKHGA